MGGSPNIIVATFGVLMAAFFVLLVFSAHAFYRVSAKQPNMIAMADPAKVSRAIPYQTRRAMALVLGLTVAVGATLFLMGGASLLGDLGDDGTWDPPVVVQTVTLTGEVATTKGAGSTNLRLMGNLANDSLVVRSAERGNPFRSETYEPNERAAVTIRRLERTELVGDDDLHLTRLTALIVLMKEDGTTDTFTHEERDMRDPISLKPFARKLESFIRNMI
jgi:hypothetical protein